MMDTHDDHFKGFRTLAVFALLANFVFWGGLIVLAAWAVARFILPAIG